MPVIRRTLLSVVIAGAVSAGFAAPADATRTERSLGNPETKRVVIEWFSLTCPHCAAFAQLSLPELRTEWIEPGRLRDARDALWPLASDAGMDRPTFGRAVNDSDLQDWIVGQAMDAESRWNVDATPSFLIDGKLFTGAMSAREFAAILAG